MNNKPILYGWYAVLSIVAVIALSTSLFSGIANAVEEDPSGIWIMAIPFVMVFVIQLLVLGALGWWLLKSVGSWNTSAMVFSAMIVPLATTMLLVWVAEKLKFPINDNQNPTPIFMIATLYIVSGVLVYNDLKYRKPKRILQEERRVHD